MLSNDGCFPMKLFYLQEFLFILTNKVQIQYLKSHLWIYLVHHISPFERLVLNEHQVKRGYHDR